MVASDVAYRLLYHIILIAISCVHVYVMVSCELVRFELGRCELVSRVPVSHELVSCELVSRELVSCEQGHREPVSRELASRELVSGEW